MQFEKNKLIDAINSALAESFEGLAFIEYDSWEIIQNIPETFTKQYITSVNICNPFKADLQLICSRQFIANTVESITGEEPADNTDEFSDTLNELLNTFAGRFMVKLLPNGEEFDFGIPDFQQFENSTIKISDTDIVLMFVFEEEKVYCVLHNIV